jgi:hypothetical protein
MFLLPVRGCEFRCCVNNFACCKFTSEEILNSYMHPRAHSRCRLRLIDIQPQSHISLSCSLPHVCSECGANWGACIKYQCIECFRPLHDCPACGVKLKNFYVRIQHSRRRSVTRDLIAMHPVTNVRLVALLSFSLFSRSAALSASVSVLRLWRRVSRSRRASRIASSSARVDAVRCTAVDAR